MFQTKFLTYCNFKFTKGDSQKILQLLIPRLHHQQFREEDVDEDNFEAPMAG